MNSNHQVATTFQNLDRAIQLLRNRWPGGVERLSMLEKGRLDSNAFEFTLELAWENAQGLFEYSGVFIEPATPRNVVKEAFAAKILPDGKCGSTMLDHRKFASHTYDERAFCAAVDALADRYLPA